MATTYAMQHFSYNKLTKLLVADASELRLSNVRDGVTVLSTTGKAVTFELAEMQRNVEGDLTYWTLMPVPGSVREDISLVIFND